MKPLDDTYDAILRKTRLAHFFSFSIIEVLPMLPVDSDWSSCHEKKIRARVLRSTAANPNLCKQRDLLKTSVCPLFNVQVINLSSTMLLFLHLLRTTNLFVTFLYTQIQRSVTTLLKKLSFLYLNLENSCKILYFVEWTHL